MSPFCHITRCFSYRRNDVSFILQLIWGDAIFVKVVAVSFSLSFMARNNCKIRFLQSNQFSLMKKISCLRTVKNNIITPVNNSAVCFHNHLYFSLVLARSQTQQQKLCTGEKLRFSLNK